jgi:hypothetical protein
MDERGGRQWAASCKSFAGASTLTAAGIECVHSRLLSEQRIQSTEIIVEFGANRLSHRCNSCRKSECKTQSPLANVKSLASN